MVLAYDIKYVRTIVFVGISEKAKTKMVMNELLQLSSYVSSYHHIIIYINTDIHHRQM